MKDGVPDLLCSAICMTAQGILKLLLAVHLVVGADCLHFLPCRGEIIPEKILPFKVKSGYRAS